jgi:predicted ester cyclase
MSLEENKQLVRRYQEIYDNNDLEGLSEVLAQNLLTPRIMTGLPSGLEGAKAAHRIMLLGFPDFQTTIDDLVAEADTVAARITMRGTHSEEFVNIPPTGRRVEFSGMYIVRIENGKIAEHWGEEDSVSLMAQLGVKPQIG